MEYTLISIFGLVSIWFLFQGWRARSSNRTVYHFFLLSGELKEPGFFGSILSTNLSIGNFLVFVAAWGFIFGWGGIIWFVINLLLNLLFFIWYLPVFQSYIENKENGGSIHEYLGLAFGTDDPTAARIIRLIASGATVLGLLFALALELHLGAKLIGVIWPEVPVSIVFSVLTGLICCYAAFGGFKTVITTDGVQAALILLGTGVLLGIFWSFRTELPPFSFDSILGTGTDLGLPSIIGIIVVGSGWFLVSMDNWQRMSATRSHKKIKRAFFAYTAAAVLFGIVYGIFGIIDAEALAGKIILPSGYEAGANVLEDMLRYITQTDVGYFLIAIIAAAFIIAAVSTADTFLIVCGHSITNDILLGFKKGRSFHNLTAEGDHYYVTIARSLVVVMGVFVLLVWFALHQFRLLQHPLIFFFIAYSIQYALFAPILFTRFKRLRPGAYWCVVCLIVGVGVSLLSGFGFWYLSIHNTEATLLGWGYIDWLYLTPVTTTVGGGLILILGMTRRVLWTGKALT